MLLKRLEKEKSIECLYDSSNIIASSYDKSTRDLTITFNHGTQYIYTNVKNSDYLRLEIADSQGSIFNKFIKPYPNTKGNLVNTQDIINEIRLYVPKVLSDVDKKFIDVIKSIIGKADDNKAVTMADIDGISGAIKEYVTNQIEKENGAV